MYTPAAKRQRLDDASNTLRKPFKSPAVVRDRDSAAGEATASSPRTDAVDTNSSSTRSRPPPSSSARPPVVRSACRGLSAASHPRL
ncbi:DNA repair protein Dds20/Mei5 [Colletotrichum asianum]